MSRPVAHTVPMLVGRDDELAVARAALAAHRPLVVTGEAGVGKTALLDHALAASAAPVRAGQCFRSLAHTAGLPLQQAFGRPVPAEDAAHTARWLVAACGGSVLRLDDLQWADPLTRDALALLPPGVSIVASVRLGDDGADAALRTMAGLGADRLDLAPLAHTDAVGLVRRLHPRLPAEQTRTLARRSGGNPLLLVELDAAAAPTIGLRRTVVARWRRHDAAARRGFAMLSLAAEPLPPSWLPDAGALVDSGLAVATADGASIVARHPLLAELVGEELVEHPDERREAARLLARAARSGGRTDLAAAASALAGEREQALAWALEAAQASPLPGQRARLLHLAATCADGPRAADLAHDAVRALVETGDYSRAEQLLDRLGDLYEHDPRRAALLGRIHWETGADADAVAAYERAVELAGPGTAPAVRYALEHARAVLLGLGDGPRGLALAQAAAADAERWGVERARALCVLGTAQHFDGDEDGLAHLATAAELAARDGDTEVEFTAVNNLVASCESMDRTQEACDRAEAGAARAGELGLHAWRDQLTAMGLNARFHLGDYPRLLDEVPTMLAGPLQRRTRDQLEIVLDLVLVDTGRTDEALARVGVALLHSADDHYGRGNLLWVRAEALLWSGDPDGAVIAAQQALDAIPELDLRLFPQLTLAHAQARSGRPVSLPVARTPAIAILTAAPAELAGHVALAAGDRAGAHAHYAQAAGQWCGRHRRGELRCRWLAADTDPDADAARRELRGLEEPLAAEGWSPLLGQVRRSLRARGVRSTAPRSRSGVLTAREREVLDLVAAGLTTATVAARLGLSTATVSAQVASARAKLGASTRRQAATGS